MTWPPSTRWREQLQKTLSSLPSFLFFLSPAHATLCAGARHALLQGAGILGSSLHLSSGFPTFHFSWEVWADPARNTPKCTPAPRTYSCKSLLPPRCCLLLYFCPSAKTSFTLHFTSQPAWVRQEKLPGTSRNISGMSEVIPACQNVDNKDSQTQHNFRSALP